MSLPLSIIKNTPFALSVFLITSFFSQASISETLIEVFNLARENDSLLRAQEASYFANKESSSLSRAALLPQINVNANVSKANIENNPDIGPQYDSDSDSEDYDVTVSQALFDLQNWHNYQQGKQLTLQAEAQFASDQQELIVRVVDAYTQVLQAIDNHDTVKAEATAIGRQLEQTRQRFEVGLTAITDVLESQASFDAANANVLSALGDVGIAFEALEILTGQPIASIAPLIDNYEAKKVEPLARNEWVNMALTSNPDLLVSELAMKAAEQNSKAKRSAHLPTVTASYQYLNNDRNTETSSFSSFSSDQRGDAVAIRLQMPIYSGGGVSAQRRQAYYQYIAAKERYNNTKRNVIQATKALHLSVNIDVARVKAQHQAIVSAQSAVDATKAGYDAGTRNIVDVLTAEKFLYQSQRAWHSARYQYINNALKLKKVAGSLTTEEIIFYSEITDANNQKSRSDYE